MYSKIVENNISNAEQEEQRWSGGFERSGTTAEESVVESEAEAIEEGMNIAVIFLLFKNYLI